jgi:hypothetical protein
MVLKSKLASAALVALTLTGAALVTSNEAQARPRWGLVAGVAAAAIVGAAIAHNAYGYGYYGYRRCRFVDRFDYYGRYIGTQKVCRVIY